MPATKAPLIVTPFSNVVLAPCGALISTSRVPVPDVFIECTALAANLLADNPIGYAIFVPTFKPPF